MTEAGQAPNAKARFHKLDPQSESIALDYLCSAFELNRGDIKSLDGFISTLKSKLPSTNGASADAGATLEVVFLKQALRDLLDVLLGSDALHKFGLEGALDRAKFVAKMMLSSPPSAPRTPIQSVFEEEVSSELMGAPSAEPILRQVLRVGALLLRKNKSYGDSALKPLRVFSKADPVEQIRVRLDDKLSRLARGFADGEDALLDLVGYYILLKVAEEEQRG